MASVNVYPNSTSLHKSKCKDNMCVPFGSVAIGEPSDFPSFCTILQCGPSEATWGEEVVADSCPVTLSAVSCEGVFKLGRFRSSFSGVRIVPQSEGDASPKPWRMAFDVSDIPCKEKPDEV